MAPQDGLRRPVQVPMERFVPIVHLVHLAHDAHPAAWLRIARPAVSPATVGRWLIACRFNRQMRRGAQVSSGLKRLLSALVWAGGWALRGFGFGASRRVQPSHLLVSVPGGPVVKAGRGPCAPFGLPVVEEAEEFYRAFLMVFGHGLARTGPNGLFVFVPGREQGSQFSLKMRTETGVSG
jgi:hypothetical protein